MLFSLSSKLRSAAWGPTLVLLFVLKEVLAIAVTEIRVLSDSHQSEYILHGEGATLTCHYLLEPNEKVTDVEWERDGELVYFWSVDEPPIAYGVLDGKVDTSQKSPGTLSILKTHMLMQGTYTCRVRTNGKTAENEQYVMVIVDACSDDAWKTHTDMITCTETINMHCVGISPKPSPACGVYSTSTGKFLSSIPFDSVNLLMNNTYEVSFNRQFKIKDWINHTDIVFKCHMMVMQTSWRSGVEHRMFGDAGCPAIPPEIEHGYYNISEDKSCWGYPVEGATVEYHCDEGYEISGSSVLECQGGSWALKGVITDEFLAPVCSDSSVYAMFYPLVVLLWTIASLIQAAAT